ncbi:ArsR/SmtB family transcription factor [Pseudokineococcus sp. 1T1Z-3]|uniref:ArsR/SmtB family transcription factor n=1 Tax=Pseudokineococcus sp. 1T1Z-3 TaxID=3132745 RepID=UPI0030A42ADF
MTMTAAPEATVDAAATGVYAALFSALSDPARLTILQHLALGPHRVRDLVEHLRLAQSTTSKHLACLRECGLVDVRAQGRASWYSLADAAALARLVDAAELLLVGTGAQVALCSHLTAGTHPTAGPRDAAPAPGGVA